MKSILIKDRRRRILFSLYERRRNVLLSILSNKSLASTVRAQAFFTLRQLPRESSITRQRNRCNLTGRPRAVYRRFGLSRIRFRKLA